MALMMVEGLVPISGRAAIHPAVAAGPIAKLIVMIRRAPSRLKDPVDAFIAFPFPAIAAFSRVHHCQRCDSLIAKRLEKGIG